MSTITREFTKEQLQQIEAAAKEVMWPVVWSEKKAREHFSEKITPKVVLKLARIALASLEAEAVGITDRSEIECLKRGEMANVMPPDYKGVDAGDEVYVYTAPPSPVSVPDDVMAAMQKVARIRLDLNGFDGDKRGILDCLSEAEEMLIEVVNRRAAMPQGAAGNSPVTPDGWVACSERMPEEGSKVIVFRPRAEESNDPPVKTATYKGGREYYHGFDCYCEPTHWMPLPAAPQQEVK